MVETKSDDEFWMRLQGNKIKIFLKSGFVYRGKLLASCNDFIEIDDIKGRKILRVDLIDNVEVPG